MSVAKIERIEGFVYRAPIETPVVTSFGIMRDRPALLVRVTTDDGVSGWGEVWCNFPSCGAEHRARLLETAVAPHAFHLDPDDPQAVTDTLTQRLRLLAIQAGEPGPLANVIAGLEIALWDRYARARHLPMAEALGGRVASATVPAYASGINPAGAVETIEQAAAAGFTRFKVKVGFDDERDRETVAAVREHLGADGVFMIDANQAWTPEQAERMAKTLGEFAPVWLEEPMAADEPLESWAKLAEASPIPLAGGENLRGMEAFDAAIERGIFAFMQPDACKWGGLGPCLTVGRRAMKAGQHYCPHYLGAGIGLVASAHLLAASGGDGWLEVDVNPNPLRDLAAIPMPAISGGTFALPDRPGLGVEPDQSAMARFEVLRVAADRSQG